MRRPREALNVWAQTCFDEVLEADPEIQFVSTELAAFDDEESARRPAAWFRIPTTSSCSASGGQTGQGFRR
jgi:hypothetical protein